MRSSPGAGGRMRANNDVRSRRRENLWDGVDRLATAKLATPKGGMAFSDAALAIGEYACMQA